MGEYSGEKIPHPWGIPTSPYTGAWRTIENILFSIPSPLALIRGGVRSRALPDPTGKEEAGDAYYFFNDRGKWGQIVLLHSL